MGKLFSKGGELVEFFVDRESIGKTLSGGDGVAFKAFIPAKTGLHQIRVNSAIFVEDAEWVKDWKDGEMVRTVQLGKIKIHPDGQEADVHSVL